VPPLHRRTLIREFNGNAKYPNTEAILNSAISLPMYPSLTNDEATNVADTFNKVVD